MNITSYLKVGDDYYYNNELCKSIPIEQDNLYLTNDYDLNYFSNDNIIYLTCFHQNKSFFSLLENYPRKHILNELKNKIISQYRSILTINVSLDKAHLFVPPALQNDFNEELILGIEYAFRNTPWPPDYRYLRYALGAAKCISKSTMRHNNKIVQVHFNPFTPYGRFGLKNKSYNILSDSKESRNKLSPISDDFIFVEFDYNAYEIRTLLALCNIKQPDEDLYNVLHTKHGDNLTRSEFKQHLISSLYANKPEKTPLETFIKKRFLKERFPIKNETLTNPFGKTMECDEYHYYSRLLQSTAAYILFHQIFKLNSFFSLFNKKSFISFCIHDSICISLHRDEIELLSVIKQILSEVEIDSINYKSNFVIKTKIGNTYAELQEVTSL